MLSELAPKSARAFLPGNPDDDNDDGNDDEIPEHALCDISDGEEDFRANVIGFFLENESGAKQDGETDQTSFKIKMRRGR